MLRRTLGAMAVLFGIAGLVMGEETRGTITKIEEESITITTGGGFGKKGEEKTFKISKDIKVIRVVGKDKDEVKLSVADLKAAHKVTNVFITVVHEGETASEIKAGGFGGGFKMGGKKDAKKKKDKDAE